MYLEVMKLSPTAQIPSRGSDKAAGYDLVCNEEEAIQLNPNDRHLFSTGIAVAIPEGYYGRIAPRSGLSFKKGLDVMAGVIDSDYRGELKVLLINHSNKEVEISPGERIAQLILTRYITPEVKVCTKLSNTVRNIGGFGSTGV